MVQIAHAPAALRASPLHGARCSPSASPCLSADCRSLSLLQLLALRPSSVRLRCRSLKVFCSSTHMIGAVMGPALLCVMEQVGGCSDAGGQLACI